MKQRLDLAVVERGLAPSRQQAQSLIMAGLVKVDGQRVDKAGAPVAEQADIVVERPLHPYVSRGGLKLEKALDTWAIDVRDAVALDVGASTGGFTHCLLLRGAARVHAIDVGYGQLDYSLRQDPRVISRERVNARHLSEAEVPELVDIAVVDVSFISLGLILGPVRARLKPAANVVALVKPQFEAGKGQVGKGGVVRNPEVHLQVLLRTVEHARDAGLAVNDIIASPIRGPNGNIEFLLWLSPERSLEMDLEARIEQAIRDGG